MSLLQFHHHSDSEPMRQSFSTLQAALLALSLYPDVVKKAQAELDAVVGPHRLPDFSDEDSLPYIQAIVLESLRWHNVVPLGVPHRTSADDEFHGYFIPAGTNIIPNTWYVRAARPNETRMLTSTQGVPPRPGSLSRA